MLFNSYLFILLFLPVTFISYFLLSKFKNAKFAQYFLISASFFFYGYWNTAYLPIIIISIIFNYYFGKILSKNEMNNIFLIFSKKYFLLVGLFVNILLLAFFKYTDFFIENINLIGGSMNQLNLLLPLAISFFTFQQIAYLVDKYNSKIQDKGFANYTLFISFFPQLIAGPIVHHSEMMPQFANPNNSVLNYKNIASGLFIFTIGLVKKVIIADSFANYANGGFEAAANLNLIEAWMTSLSYTFQLYFDFSGYADMAIGIALLFNIKLPINFNSPYKAINIQEFWRRWHMTLSRFMRDYIYIPLGGNRSSEIRICINILITFLIGGLWHGAGWTFLFWGLLHGSALVVNRIWHTLPFRMWKWLSWFITFNFVNIAWIFFRAPNWNDATLVLSSMFRLENLVLPRFIFKYINSFEGLTIRSGGILANMHHASSLETVWIVVGFALVLGFKNSNHQMVHTKRNAISYIYIGLLLFFALISINAKSEFLYFNF